MPKPSTVSCKRCAAPLESTSSGGLCPACLSHLAKSAWLNPALIRCPEPESHLAHPKLPCAQASTLRPRYFGDYELLEEIARGGMGIVFRARQLSLNRIVAVKMIRAGVLASELDIARFQAEARAAAGLQHPNIIAIHEVGELDDHHYFSMEYVEGRNLSHCVREHPWAAPRAARCLEIIADTVHYAHQQGILHRDLKPSNVIIDASDTPHLTDFGLATRIEEASGLTLSGSILGTPSYMAPEQTGGRSLEIGAATDTYALGALLYEVLTGRPPFQGETPLETIKLVRDTDPVPPRRLNPSIPSDLETICLKCLEKEPKRRYTTARALAEDLGHFLRHEPIQARPVPRWELGLKWIRRNPWRAALAAASTVAFLTAVGFAFELAANYENRRVIHQLTLTELDRSKVIDELDHALRQSRSAHREERLQRERAQAAELKSIVALQEVQVTRHTASRNEYLRGIAEAHQALEAHSIAEAERLLDRCAEPLRRWEWRYLRGLTRPEAGHHLMATNDVRHLTVSRNGAHAAAVDAMGSIQLLNVASGAITQVGKADPDLSAGMILATQAPYLVLVGASGDGYPVQFFPPRSNHPESLEMKLGTRPRALMLGADDTLLLSVGDQGLTAWDLETGTPRWCAAPPARCTGIGVDTSQDGTTVVWVTAPSQREKNFNGDPLEYRGNMVHIHDARDGSLLRRFSDDIHDVRTVAIGPQARRLATGHADGRIRLWDIASGDLEGSMQGHAGAVADLAFDASERRLISGGVDRIVRLWTLGISGKPSIYLGHRNEILSVAFSSEDNQIIAASQDGSVRVWDLKPPRLAVKEAVPGHTLAFVDNDRLVLGTGNMHSALNGDFVRTLGPGAPQSRVSVDTNNEWIAFKRRAYGKVGDGFQATAWSSTLSDQISCTALLGKAGVIAMPLPAPDTQGSGVGVFQLDDGREAHRLIISPNSRFENLVYDMTFNPGGDFLAVATGSWSRSGMGSETAPGHVQLWDWRNSKLVRSLQAQRFCVWTTAFTPDGLRLVSAGGLYKTGQRVASQRVHGEIQIWDVASGCELFDLPGVTDNVFGIAISPDGTRVAAAMGKHAGRIPGEVKLWDLETGAEVLTLRGFSGPVHGVAFSPDGNRLAAIGSGMLRIWSVE